VTSVAMALNLAGRRWLNPYWLMIAPLVLMFAVFYVWPGGIMVMQSVTDPTPGLENYRQLLVSASIQKIFLTTFRIGAITTIFSVFFGYVVAYVMNHVGRLHRTIMILLVLIPFWLSLVVRCFSLLVLLRDSGLINQGLMGLGLETQPTHMINNEYGVVVGMIHSMVPYAALLLFSNMRGIDKRLVAAAKGMGASAFQSFWRIYLPLSFPGIFAATLLVGILTLGFFVIPAFLGGGRTMMVAEYVSLQALQVSQLGLSAMMSVVLLVAVLLILIVAARFINPRAVFGAK
jgi:putative spermidine/putrescine transport system permease protein